MGHRITKCFCKRFVNNKAFLQRAVLFSPAGTTHVQGGQVVRLSCTRLCGPCAGVARSFACAQAAIEWVIRSVQGRRVPSSLAPSWQRLPARTPLCPANAFSMPCTPPAQARVPLSLRVFASVSSCLSASGSGLPPVCPDPPRAPGIVGTNPASFTGGIRGPTRT